MNRRRIVYGLLLVMIASERSLAQPGGTLVETDTDRPGMDYKHFDLSEPRPELCQTACATEAQCKAYTYVKPWVQGPQARCWLKSDVPSASSNQCCISGIKNVTVATALGSPTIESDMDRPGVDYRNFDLSEARPELCWTACNNESQCRAYSYVKPGVQGPNARCWLKSGVPNQIRNQCCVSGVKVEPLPQIPQSVQSLRLGGIVHVQNLGDQLFRDSQWVGTKGQSLRLEGFAVDFTPRMPGLALEYMCHLQDTGDTPWMGGLSFCGTRGQSRRLEGLAIRLTGPGASNYDIYYACHLQDLGDTGPVANGAFCGTRGQSRRLEALEVWVFPKGSPPPPLFSEILPYDLVSSGPFDKGQGQRCPLSAPSWDNLNNIPKNPFWGHQLTNNQVTNNCGDPRPIPNPYRQCPQGTTPLLPFLFAPPPESWYEGNNPCTHIRVTYDSGFGFGFCHGPHVEFRPVMYEGIIRWEGKSTEGEDDDYEIDIYRSGTDDPSMNDAAMYSNNDHIEIEFDSDETVDWYTTCLPSPPFPPNPCLNWWLNFKNHVNESDFSIGQWINGHRAIIIAPADLDATHGYSIELHPAWLFMVHFAWSPTSDGYGFFIRNWGNKGACSDDDHPLRLQNISVLLERPGSVDGHIKLDPSSGTELAGTPGTYLIQSWQPGQGLAVTFLLPPPDDHGWIAGYIYVEWTMSPVAPAPPPLVVKLPPKQEAILVPAQPPAEATIASLMSGMTADQRAGYLKDWRACRPHLASPSNGPVEIRQGSIPPSPAKSPMGSSVPIPSRPARCRALALCKAFNNKIPGNAEVCDKLR